MRSYVVSPDLIERTRAVSAQLRTASEARIDGPPRPSDRLRPMFTQCADLLEELARVLESKPPAVAAVCEESEEGGCYMFAAGSPIERAACRRACLMVPRLAGDVARDQAERAEARELADHLLILMKDGPHVEDGDRQNLISHAHGFALGLCSPESEPEPLKAAAIIVLLTEELTELSNAENPKP